MSVVFVFPGQGSQSMGMLSSLNEAFPQVADTFSEASEALGYDLWKIVSEGPSEELNKTQITQPAMLASGVAVWRLWLQQGGAQPQWMAGHSLGEYSALCSAGSIAFADAVKLVSTRGQLMQEAVPAGTGAMAAVLGLDDQQVIAVCEDAADGEILAAVNFNAPGQVVIAGTKAAVERAVPLAKERGAKRALILPVSVPSHCALMQPAADHLQKYLQNIDIQSPTIPVVNNVNVSMESDPDEIRKALVQQLSSPVRWVETIRNLAQQGCTQLIECGPGKVLTGLNKRIEKGMIATPLFDPQGFEKLIEQ